ncbi:unnamed protein product [Mytilus coruscus]|uniref:Reverse transcriptase domain-containing protein n=1 Tax=Mytilus coruscus TaxID=42192 RepID=A0A6J8C2V2_MYTCO|nr:unnamed protein product [Mytilus coruscus]
MGSRVKWDGQFSRAFDEQQGVRQGGILSPTMYKIYINPLLDWYQNKHFGFRIGTIHAASPACADDIVLLAEDAISLQTMLNLQETLANKDRYLISETKINFGNIVRNNDIEKEICIRQLILNDITSRSWFIYVNDILSLYDFESIFDVLNSIPNRESWKNYVKKRIETVWRQKIMIMAERKSTLRLLHPMSMNCGTVHNIWANTGLDSISIMKANVKARLLTGVYTLKSAVVDLIRIKKSSLLKQVNAIESDFRYVKSTSSNINTDYLTHGENRGHLKRNGICLTP